MKLYHLAFFLFIGITIISCSTKSPEEYGKAYCDCMKENNGNMKKCKEILEDAKYDHDGEDEEVQRAFINSYNSCMNAH